MPVSLPADDSTMASLTGFIEIANQTPKMMSKLCSGRLLHRSQGCPGVCFKSAQGLYGVLGDLYS